MDDKLVRDYPDIYLERLNKTAKNLRIAIIPAEIRTEYLHSTRALPLDQPVWCVSYA
jgi:hypothetical protein